MKLSLGKPLMSFEFARSLWVVTAAAIAFAIGLGMFFGPAAVHAGDWLTLGLIGVLGFLVWSIALGFLFLLYGR
jgi:hypothetical protein